VLVRTGIGNNASRRMSAFLRFGRYTKTVQNPFPFRSGVPHGFCPFIGTANSLFPDWRFDVFPVGNSQNHRLSRGRRDKSHQSAHHSPFSYDQIPLY